MTGLMMRPGAEYSGIDCESELSLVEVRSSIAGESEPASPSTLHGRRPGQAPSSVHRVSTGPSPSAASGATVTDADTDDTGSDRSAEGHHLAESSSQQQQRQPATTLTAAAFHIFNANVGAGVFLLPTFYTSAGSIVGAVLALLAGYAILDCMLMLLEVKRRIRRAEVQSYPAVVDFVLGSSASRAVQCALAVFQFGFCIMYLNYAASLGVAAMGASPRVEMYFVAAGVLIVTPLTFLSHKLELLAYASLLASGLLAFCIFGTLVWCAKLVATSGRAPSARLMTWPPTSWVLFLSGHVMSLEGIGAMLPVENSVKEKRRFSVVVRVTISSIILMFFVFGQLGYAAFGDALKTSVVNELKNSWFSLALQIAVAVSMLLSFPIQYVPAIEIVDKALGVAADSRKGRVLRAVLNVAFGLVAAAAGGEALETIAEFLGAFVGTHLTLTFPALLMLFVAAATGTGGDGSSSGVSGTAATGSLWAALCREPWTARRAKCAGYLVLSLFVCVAGTTTVLARVVADSRKSSEPPLSYQENEVK